MKLFWKKQKNWMRSTGQEACEAEWREKRRTSVFGLFRPSGRQRLCPAGVFSLLLFFCLFLSSCGSSSGYDGPVYERLASGKGAGEASSEEAAEGEDPGDADALYMIESFESAEEHIILRDLENRRLYRYSYGMDTDFLSKFGGKAVMTDFHPGSVVTIGGLDSDHKLKEIRFSDKAFVMDDVTNYSMDQSRNIFTIGQTNYEMNEETEVFSGDILSDVNSITANDILRVVGIDKKIISLSITTGHGFLYVTNTDTFADSLMQIGDRTFVKVTAGEMTVEVPEGTYDVTVAKGGYGGTASVTVGRGETVNLNLDDLRGEGPKTCQITFSIGVDGAHIYLDGSAVQTGTPVSVQYGQHALKVIAEGYNEWARTLVVNSPTAEISLDISDEKKTTSGETNNAASSTSSANAQTNTNGSSANGSSGGSTANGSASGGTAGNGTSSGTSGSSTSGVDRNGDGVYDEKDAQLDFLSTLSNMLNTMNSGNNN